MVLIVQYSCAVVSVFGSGGKTVSVLHTYVLRVQYNCGVVLVFWFWWEIVLGVTYVLSVQYSCAVVSFFCCGGKINFIQIPYSHDCFSKISISSIITKTNTEISLEIMILIQKSLSLSD